MTTKRIQDLAKEMGVSEADVLMFAQSIANGLERDGVDQIYLDTTDSIRTDLLEGYAADSVIKFNNFQAKLMTNKEAKETFCLDVLNKIKGD
jgi:hypothetical protein